MGTALDLFSGPTRDWFLATFAEPTDVQERGWREVASGRHVLMAAPTGSGKTLAAFLWCLDRLAAEPMPPDAERCRVLYVSPLKALAHDVDRNLRSPLVGISRQMESMGMKPPEIAVAIRTGDTPADARRSMERHPPDILITTPESLFLLLTSAARRILASVRWLIVDEIHSVAATKRGSHLALSLERLCEITKVQPQRIGLSATQRPLQEVGRFLGGTSREVAIVDAGRLKTMEVAVEVPVEDMSRLSAQDDGGAIQNSIWPAIYPRLLELIQQHRSTIVFVNSRRLAERLAARLNELAGEELVRAHHGSIAREQRLLIEDMLKAGSLRGLVATSTLELGIDMGAVDLVLQVEAPPSVAAGIQRVGRAGHSVGEVSRGVVLPKFRGDLLETAAVVEGMLEGRIEATVVPRKPLDVLAQQVVAMCAMDEWKVDDLAATVRRAYPYSDLGPRAFESVLDMLSGRYPSDEFAELRPRLVWDRVAGTVRGRAGAQRLAVTNPGTIPDRGLYSVNLVDDGRRVGELDEEMVYESRVGETFVLGASTWRIAEITSSQVLVTPAPGEPGKIAFWKADAPSRPAELGMALGKMVRELREASPKAAAERLRTRAGFDDRAIKNLLTYLDDQAAATGVVPDDRTVVVERFRDEVGDWRVCLHTPLGGRVHAPLALALEARLQDKLAVHARALWTDDGIALHLPDVDDAPQLDELLLDPDEVKDLVTSQLPGSALFAARFRENAARSLLLPKRRPGQRTPLWQQRMRSAGLLQVAGRYPDFPILAETWREVMSDHFDMPALNDLLTRIRSRQVRVVAVDTERASPFASSLLFSYVAEFMYEGDAPLAERRAQALTLDRELLAELLGSEDLRELLDPEAIAQVELELQCLLPERFPRDPDEAHDLLVRLGDLSEGEATARGVAVDWLDLLVRSRRAVELRVAGQTRWIAAEDAGRYREALGAGLPVGLPDAFLDPGPRPLESLVRRFARTHAPFVAADVAARWGTPESAIEEALAALVDKGEVIAGEFRNSTRGREHCHPEVLRLMRRRSLAALRREVESVPPDAMARFLPEWHGIGSRAHGMDRLLEVVFQLQGVALPASVIERDVIASRVHDYNPRLLDELVSMGEVVWAGRGSLGTNDGRVALYLRGDAPRLVAEPPADKPSAELHQRIRAHLEARGASFFRDIYNACGGGDEDLMLDALWDLVWSGEVTNDTFAPLRLIGPAARRPARRPRLPRLLQPRAAGRWSLLSTLVGAGASVTERLHAEAGVLLQRHGVLTRDAVVGEGWAGGFAGLYPVLRAMEESGRIRRGYFVEGLGGSQFALPGAVDRLRSMRDATTRIVALAATDPANAYGTVLPWPESDGRLARASGAYCVLDSGRLVLYLEKGGRSLLTHGEVNVDHVRALIELAAAVGKVEVQRIDGEPAVASRLTSLMREGGFSSTHRGLVAYGGTGPKTQVGLPIPSGSSAAR
ncbi:MAG TPA: DEAD/DEAH box helicase [Candidatus Dormibacteraeota bacterium]|nr:DEAD/DEAH box helicase [Candidatus Dormibacteraeota bacterium]